MIEVGYIQILQDEETGGDPFYILIAASDYDATVVTMNSFTKEMLETLRTTINDILGDEV